MDGYGDMALMGHLMRKAGVGARREELEAYVAKGYEVTMQQLLHAGTGWSDGSSLIDAYIGSLRGY